MRHGGNPQGRVARVLNDHHVAETKLTLAVTGTDGESKKVKSNSGVQVMLKQMLSCWSLDS